MSASTRYTCRGSGRRAHARARAWAAGAAPDHDGWLHLDVDATITVDHSDNKENAAATWKHSFGFHSLLVFLDRFDIAAGEALAGLLRPGNAGSNTAADHITVLGQALEALPPRYRPTPDNPAVPQVLIRSDSAGATYGFAAACRDARVGFSLGAAIDAAVREAVEVLTANDGWYPAITTHGGIREGAWVAEATDLVGGRLPTPTGSWAASPWVSLAPGPDLEGSHTVASSTPIRISVPLTEAPRRSTCSGIDSIGGQAN